MSINGIALKTEISRILPGCLTSRAELQMPAYILEEVCKKREVRFDKGRGSNMLQLFARGTSSINCFKGSRQAAIFTKALAVTA